MAGSSNNGSDTDFALARYNADGTLDTSFGTGGKVTTPIGSGNDMGVSAALQDDGKIVVAGMSHNGTNYDFALARYSTDGSLDTSFSGDGKLTTSFGSMDDAAYSVVIQSDGKIVATGYYTVTGGDNDFALARYNTDGSLDTSFDTDGKVTTNIGVSDNAAFASVLQPDGKIVTAGYSYTGVNDWDFALARYNTNGSLDNSFDSDGLVVTSISALDDMIYGIAIQPDWKIVAVGYTNNGSNFDFALARYATTGALDTSFDGDGKKTVAFGSGNDVANAVAVQSDGKMVASGYSNNGSNNDFALARFATDGALDTGFNSTGKVTTAIGSSTDESYSVAIQSDGKIMAAGRADMGTVDFALVRYASTGALDDLSGYACVQADVTDSDADNTVDVHVCSTNSFTGTACSATTFCTITGAKSGDSAQCVANGMVPVPTSHGAHNVYVFTVDGFGVQGTGTSAQSYSVTDVPPYITQSSDYSVSAIALTAGNSTAKAYTVTVKDDNGDNDLTETTTGYLYDSNYLSLSNGACTANDHSCYADSVCSLSANTSGTDNEATATCAFDVWFNANYSSGWKLHVNPADQQGNVTTQTDSNAVATNALQGLNIPETAIAYGTLALGATSSGVAITVENVGNQVIDLLVQGADMARAGGGATIPLGQQQWHNTTQDFTYDLSAPYDTGANPLVADASDATTKALGCADRDLAVRLRHDFGSTKWGTAQLIETDDLGDVYSPSIASDSSGNMIAVWQQVNGTRTNIWANRYTVGSGWGIAQLIETDDLGDVYSPSIASDPSGNMIAVWSQGDGTRDNIWANRYTVGSGWGTAQLIETDNAGSASSPQIASDPSGNMIAVWSQNDGTRSNIYANRYGVGVGWSGRELIETENLGTAWYPEIASDPSGNMIAMWYQHDGTRWNIWGNRYATGVGWGTAELIETDNAGDARYPAIAADGLGNMMAVWWQSDGTRQNTMANRYTAGVGWGTAQLIETSDSGNAENAKIASDPSGNMIAVWQQLNGIRRDMWANRFTFGFPFDETLYWKLQMPNPQMAGTYTGTNTLVAAAKTQCEDGELAAPFKVTTDVGGSDYAESVAIQTDGKIIAAGYAHNGNDSDFALVRYNPDSSLDLVFGTGGKVMLDIGVGSNDEAFSIALQPDGKIVAAGSSNNDFALARFTATGALDTAFGTNGKVITDFGGGEQAYSVALQSDGKIVVAGYTSVGYDFALARYNADGSLDTDFDSDGKVTTSIGVLNDVALSIAIQSDGKIVVAGYSGSGFALVRYTTTGATDDTFGTGGIVTTDFGGGTSDQAFSVAIQNDGRIVAAGGTSSGGSQDFALARYTSNGALDTTFGTAGKVTTDFGGGYDQAYSIAIQPDGKIVAVGWTDKDGPLDFALVRYTSDGTVDN